MQIELASHLKRQRYENCKDNTNVEQYIKKLNKQNCQNTGHVYQTKKVCPVYSTYPITELKMH